MEAESEEFEFPLMPLMAGATALHENMVSFVNAGFTRTEAMRIVLTLLTETIRANIQVPPVPVEGDDEG